MSAFQEADEALTHMANGNEMAMDHRLWVTFRDDAIEDREATAKEGRPMFKNVPWVRIQAPGDKLFVYDQPANIGNHPMCHNKRFAAQWRAFKEGQDQSALEGLPLKEWPQVLKSQVLELAYHGVRTVEQLANMSDGNVQRCGPGIIALRQKAKDFIEVSKESRGRTELQNELKRRDDRLAELEAKLAALTGASVEAPAPAQATPSPVTSIGVTPVAPKKRGRPPKADVATT